MLDSTMSQVVLYFIIYSIFGWVCETIWCSVGARKFVYRGFLAGPYCPIYGFGALIVFILCEPLRQWPLLVFVVAILAVSVLEYFTGWILETLFKTRWWDYSSKKLNIKGRVCLLNSAMFGFLALAAVYFLHPQAQKFIALMQPQTQRVAASVTLAVLVIDIAHTLATVTNLEERLASLKGYLDELERYDEEYSWLNKKSLSGSVNSLREVCAQEGSNTKAKVILDTLDKLTSAKGAGKRLVKAFPGMVPRGRSEELTALKETWQRKHEEQKLKKKQKEKENESVKQKTEKKATVYQGVTFTRMVWVFLIGCVIGYVIETLFCFATQGKIESRQGMVYGPFSQIYGFGAVVLALTLAPLAKKSDAWLFFGGGIIGGLFEAACSLVQELAFGTVSWEYSSQSISFLGGRTSLLYMFFWGVLSVAYMRLIYPAIVRLIDRISLRPRRFFTIAIVVVLLADMLLSAAAVSRWTARLHGKPPQNSVEQFLDSHYTNEMLKEIYPNMKVVGLEGKEEEQAQNGKQ